MQKVARRCHRPPGALASAASIHYARSRRSLLAEIMFAPFQLVRIRPYRLWGPEPPLYLKSPHGPDPNMCASHASSSLRT
ncbi:hypothetical protein K466DRAFT_582084 [Polyporus arcularius HHB13444]|uniref:Uncharacterized protein n=1 Tax=Polyporus arcularius HHB13444 TaxID=1314778 RepID=A0A5C3PWK3_9APHY|nr:hypothetical protein K466DRAFT_582084 [Polyporus arcularius HHB13444]